MSQRLACFAAPASPFSSTSSSRTRRLWSICTAATSDITTPAGAGCSANSGFQSSSKTTSVSALYWKSALFPLQCSLIHATGSPWCWAAGLIGCASTYCIRPISRLFTLSASRRASSSSVATSRSSSSAAHVEPGSPLTTRSSNARRSTLNICLLLMA